MSDTACGSAMLELFGAINQVGRSAQGWTRPPWSEEVRAAEAIVIAAATGAGLAARHDEAGNLWLLDPNATETGLVAAGSHLDTVPDGGAYDGALGVACAVAAVSSLREAGVAGAERLAVIAFADEEGWRFGTPIYGSRVLTGGYGPDILDRVDGDGIVLRDCAPPDPFAARGRHRRLDAFFEVHVEQGRALDPLGVPLGIATGLAARTRDAFLIDGSANHAGTTPMEGRSDALVAAAGLILDADVQARSEPGAVATVGRLVVEPGGANVIPGRVTGTLDVRAPTPDARDRVRAALSDLHPAVRFEEQSRDDGVEFDRGLRRVLADAGRRVGVATTELASFAGHDAGILQGAGVPSAMLFVRSPDGVSHHPSEYASNEDCCAAADVLREALATVLSETHHNSPIRRLQ